MKSIEWGKFSLARQCIAQKLLQTLWHPKALGRDSYCDRMSGWIVKTSGWHIDNSYCEEKQRLAGRKAEVWVTCLISFYGDTAAGGGARWCMSTSFHFVIIVVHYLQKTQPTHLSKLRNKKNYTGLLVVKAGDNEKSNMNNILHHQTMKCRSGEMVNFIGNISSLDQRIIQQVFHTCKEETTIVLVMNS